MLNQIKQIFKNALIPNATRHSAGYSLSIPDSNDLRPFDTNAVGFVIVEETANQIMFYNSHTERWSDFLDEATIYSTLSEIREVLDCIDILSSGIAMESTEHTVRNIVHPVYGAYVRNLGEQKVGISRTVFKIVLV